MWVSQAFPITPLKTRMTLENPHVQKEIHLQMVDVPVSCYCSFRGVRFHANQQTNQPTNQTHSTTTYPRIHVATSSSLSTPPSSSYRKPQQKLAVTLQGTRPYPTEKEHHLKKAFKKGYVICQEDKNHLWPTLFEIRKFVGFSPQLMLDLFLIPSIHFIHQWWIFNYTWWIFNYQYGGLLIFCWSPNGGLLNIHMMDR